MTSLLAPEWLEGSGVTYRQLDYWARQGWLLPETRDGGTGPGYHRRWPEPERRVAALMSRLVASGLTPTAAAPVARAGAPRLLRDKVATVEIAPGVYVVIDDA